MTLTDMQQDMRTGYLAGAPGVLVSGIVWLVAGIAGWQHSLQAGMLTLFFGGMLINPLSMQVSKLGGRSGHHQSGNPFAKLALESTVLLFVGLYLGFTVASIQGSWFFAVMLLLIGGRYLLFHTLYGLRIYWILGAVLMILGVVGIQLSLPGYMAALLGGATEVLFAVIIWLQEKQRQSASPG